MVRLDQEGQEAPKVLAGPKVQAARKGPAVQEDLRALQAPVVQKDRLVR